MVFSLLISNDATMKIIFGKIVFGAQKNHLIETVLLTTHSICVGNHNICFIWEIRKLIFDNTLNFLSGGLKILLYSWCIFSSYTLRCTVMDDWGRVKLAFDLEVCVLPKTSYIGVCRKRVKGDTWHYKKLCEDILATSKL